MNVVLLLSFGVSICHVGLKIPVIENLGATNDHFDTFDLCDNDLIKLDSFPPLKRLETLVCVVAVVPTTAGSLFYRYSL